MKKLLSIFILVRLIAESTYSFQSLD